MSIGKISCYIQTISESIIMQVGSQDNLSELCAGTLGGGSLIQGGHLICTLQYMCISCS